MVKREVKEYTKKESFIEESLFGGDGHYKTVVYDNLGNRVEALNRNKGESISNAHRKYREKLASE